MKPVTFSDLFCTVYQCKPEDLDEAVFWRCLFPHTLFLARVILKLNRDYFAPDFELIQHVKNLSSSEDIRQELADFNYHYPSRGLLRRNLRVRVSGQRLVSVADRLFARKPVVP